MRRPPASHCFFSFPTSHGRTFCVLSIFSYPSLQPGKIKRGDEEENMGHTHTKKKRDSVAHTTQHTALKAAEDDDRWCTNKEWRGKNTMIPWSCADLQRVYILKAISELIFETGVRLAPIYAQ